MFSSFLYLQKTTKIMTKGKKKEKFVKIHNSEQKLFFFKSRKSCINYKMNCYFSAFLFLFPVLWIIFSTQFASNVRWCVLRHIHIFFLTFSNSGSFVSSTFPLVLHYQFLISRSFSFAIIYFKFIKTNFRQMQSAFQRVDNEKSGKRIIQVE